MYIKICYWRSFLTIYFKRIHHFLNELRVNEYYAVEVRKMT